MKINHEQTKNTKKARKAFVFLVSTWLIFWGGGKRISSLPTSVQEPEWSGQSSGALAKLSGVFFVDRDRGWVVGSNGTLLATEDGGAKWRRQTLPERQSGEALNDVWFFNPDRGLLLGEYGLFNRKGDIDWSERVFLLMSKDRGASWAEGTLQRPPIPQSGRQERLSGGNPGGDTLKTGRRPSDAILLRMSFANDRVGWAVGESGTIQRTIDGGGSWTLQDASARKLLYDVAAIDDRHVWAVGAGGTILRTIDGGRNWNDQSSGVIQPLRAVHFADPQNGWAVGAKGVIISTSNGGASWRRQTSGVELNLNDVVFLNAKEGSGEGPREGWIAGDRGLLLHTTDGGATWENVELSARANLSRLFFIAPDCGWVVGTSGAIFKYGSVK
ncbi:MAG TPA: YCF48-related protein [Blastocatellia bacterium]|nr:YCF48-related protein [Blastocatellia bacterium]